MQPTGTIAAIGVSPTFERITTKIVFFWFFLRLDSSLQQWACLFCAILQFIIDAIKNTINTAIIFVIPFFYPYDS